MKHLQQSQLKQLPNGQIIGFPITRTALKRQHRQSRLQRRGLRREWKRMGVSYNDAAIISGPIIPIPATT